MSRESERRSEQDPGVGDTGDGEQRGRTGPAQFVGEVRSELKRVHWANRRELVSYSLVVIVAVVAMTAYISGVDAVFSRLVFAVFG